MSELHTNYMGYDLFSDDLDQLPELSKITINTINQYSFCVAEEDVQFKKALNDSDVLLPDGIGIVLALKFTTGQNVKKISGTDMHNHLLSKLNATGGKCFYMGSSENTLALIKLRLSNEYPNIICETYSPPYKDTFSDSENDAIIGRINAFNPDALFVGMTAPKQEKWAMDQKERINAKLICSIGAVFDFFAGTVKRPGQVWINLGLEWFVRLCNEPKRMWKRYLIYGPVFVYILIKEKFRIDFQQPSVSNAGFKKISN